MMIDNWPLHLKATGREEVAEMADSVAGDLRADADIMIAPEKYYDRVIEIDLSRLEPYINGPFLIPMPLRSGLNLQKKYWLRLSRARWELHHRFVAPQIRVSQDLSRAGMPAIFEEKHLKVAAPRIVEPRF